MAAMSARKRLKLSSEEVRIIKGLIAHSGLNDQTIVAMFSHASRTINHREIGFIRKNHQKYSAVAVASKQEVESFLSNYQRFERLAMAAGIVPQEAHFQLVQKAAEAMKAAVAIFNNPSVKWKSEIFIVNAVIAWTYLMHAYYLTKGIDYRYLKNGQPELTEDGRPKHWELSKCISTGSSPLVKAVRENLRYLILIRNEIEHRLSDNIDRFVAPKLQACALNFEQHMCEWFGQGFSIAEELTFAIQFSELSLRSNSPITGSQGLPAVIKTANAAIEAGLTDDEYNDPRYSYRVYLVPRTTNNPKKADQAVYFSAPGSEVELAVREVERPKYLASDIVRRMQEEGHKSFSVYGKKGFVSVWQGIEGARDQKNGYGVQVGKTWYWYDKMLAAVRDHLKKVA